MVLKAALQHLVAGKSLTEKQAVALGKEMTAGEASDILIGAVLTALRMKGETVAEITGLALAMQQASIKVDFPFPVADTCGNGGDDKNTFNISTTTAFVLAASGVKVAKHGNRAASSKSGSADVLEELGVKIDLLPEQVKECVEQIGIGFFFAVKFHPAMKHVMQARKDIGIRTIFNFLGPLLSPASAKYQVIGTPDPLKAESLIQVSKKLGAEHVLVVCGEDGMDEVSLSAPTTVWEYKRSNAKVRKYSVTPEQFGLKRAALPDLQSFSKKDSAEIIHGVLDRNIKGPKRDVIVLNSAAALVVADKVATWEEGIELAKQLLDSKKPMTVLNKLVAFSQSF